ncbi:MAG: threonine--tRNA ligase [Pseudomonadota bacterium]
MKTAGEILKEAGKLSDQTIGARVNGETRDLQFPVDGIAAVEPLEADGGDAALRILRHSTSHVMADAVQRLFPGTKVTIGPSIEDGFYYDFDRPEGAFTEEDLGGIEKKMREILKKERSAFARKEVSKKEAAEFFSGLKEAYKLELLEDIPEGEKITLYTHGQWTDLCAGPHLPSTKPIRHFKIMKTSGAFWRGDERNKMLSRVYGTAFFSKEALDGHLKRLEEAKKRDHRRLGTDLDLFSIDERVGGGLVLWHPRGAFVRHKIEQFWTRAHFEAGYGLVGSPHVGKVGLWETSGHMGFYKDFMYPPVDLEGQQYMLKPMNCPFAMMIYRSKVRSWRDLPLRWAELGTVYRYEKSGQLLGLLRVRGFTQDDAHVFCRREDMGREIVGIVRLSVSLLKAFGFDDFYVRLATRPAEGYIGEVALWDEAEKHLKAALDDIGFDYELDEGGGAFYGPKIDIDVKDVLGRRWQCTTAQLDFNLPERFELRYAASDGTLKRPIMLHRALLGSLERFFGVLIEHYAGAFPGWLSPEQIVLMNVTADQEEAVRKVEAAMRREGIRTVLDLSSSKLGAKIREARLMRIPYIGVVGGREAEQAAVSLRGRVEDDMGVKTNEEAIAALKEKCREPDLDLSGLYT